MINHGYSERSKIGRTISIFFLRSVMIALIDDDCIFVPSLAYIVLGLKKASTALKGSGFARPMVSSQPCITCAPSFRADALPSDHCLLRNAINKNSACACQAVEGRAGLLGGRAP